MCESRPPGCRRYFLHAARAARPRFIMQVAALQCRARARLRVCVRACVTSLSVAAGRVEWAAPLYPLLAQRLLKKQPPLPIPLFMCVVRTVTLIK
jgi:hypothetical protein